MQTLVPLIIGNTAVATALAMVAWICGRCGRPALAHAVWLLVIVKLLTPPLWPVEVASEPKVQRQQVVSVAPVLPLERSPSLPKPAKPKAVERSVPMQLVASAPRPEPSYSLSQVLAALWAAGSIAISALAGFRVIRFMRTLRTAAPADDRLLHDVHQLGQRLGLARPPQLCVVDEPVSPMLWFIGGRPRLILPRRLLDRMELRQRDGVIAHELAHLKRRDHWVRLLELPATIALWWHPLIWAARRGLREAEEQCCDAWAVSVLPDGRRCYADALVDALGMIGRPGLPLAATGLGQLSTLKRRLTMIVTQSPPKSLSLTGRALVVVLFGAVAIAPVRGQAPEGESRPKQSPATGATTSAVDDTTRQAVLALLEASQDRDPNVSQAARRALLRFGAPAASALIEALDDPKSGQHAIVLLAQLGPPAVDELVKALASHDPIVRGHSLQALDHMVKPGSSGFGEMMGLPMMEPSMMGMEGMGMEMGMEGIGMPGGFGGEMYGVPQDPKLASRLIGPASEVATDSEPTVRRAAVRLLSRIASVKPDKALVQPLLGALKDDQVEVRVYAAQGLHSLGPMAAGAVDALVAAIGDTDLSVRLAALDALAAMGSDAKAAMPGVVAAMKSPEPQLRSAAARTLGAMQAKPAVSPGAGFMMEDPAMAKPADQPVTPRQRGELGLEGAF